MSLTMLLAICVLACDLTLYIFFRWTFGERYRGRGRRAAARRRLTEGKSPRHYLVSARTEHRRRDTELEVA
jgi:hypothetical protein